MDEPKKKERYPEIIVDAVGGLKIETYIISYR